MMTKFLDMFCPVKKGNFGLTDEAVYKSIQYGGTIIPLYGGSQEHDAERFISEYGKTIYDEPITIFNGDGIIISLDGSSGCMTYKESGQFALNHHAGFFQSKLDSRIMPKFFSLFYTRQLQEVSLSEGSKTLSLDQLYSIDFDIPPLSTQKSVMEFISPLITLKYRAKHLLHKIKSLLEKSLIINPDGGKRIPLSEIVEYTSRNDSLSEEGVYQRSSEITKAHGKIKVISGSTEGFYGYYPIDNSVHTVNNRPCLQVVTRGKACSMRFLEKGIYATNTNAMLLTIKDEAKTVLGITNEFDEEVYLRFLEYIMYPFFKGFSSSADLSVFPLTEAISELEIPLIRLDGRVKAIASQYQTIKNYEGKLSLSLYRIDDLFNKSICA